MPAIEKALAFGSSVCFRVLLEEVKCGRLLGGKLGSFRNIIDGRGRGHFRQQLNAAVVLEARPRGMRRPMMTFSLRPRR